MYLLIYSVLVFAIAGLAGFYFYKNYFWNFIDIIYYPLAAVGVILLFLNNENQRLIIEAKQTAEQHRAVLEKITTQKPDIQMWTNDELLDGSIKYFDDIVEWGRLCKNLGTDPKCLALNDLPGNVASFVETLNQNYSSYDIRLSTYCSAAENLIQTIQTKELISSVIMVELLNQYKISSMKNIFALDYNSFNKEVDEFSKKASEEVNNIHRLAFKSGDNSGDLSLDISKAQIEYGKMIFRGLYPCIVSPKQDLDKLSKWTFSRLSEEQEVKRLEDEIKRNTEKPKINFVTLWLQLNLWPLVLITALSLKFSKGIAALRKSWNKE